VAVEIRVGLAGDGLDAGEVAALEDRGFVGGEDRLPGGLELGAAGLEGAVDGLDLITRGALLRSPCAALEDVDLKGAERQVDAHPDHLELARVELLRLDEDLLADANFPEIVEERGVLDLADLLGGPAGVAVGAGGLALDGPGQAHGQVGDPAGVAAGGRVPLLDGRHGRLDEALEKRGDLGVKQRIFQGNRGLRGEGEQELLAAGVEGHHLGLDVLGGAKLGPRVSLLVDELEHPHHVAPVVDERGCQHRPGAVPDTAVKAWIKGEASLGGDLVDVVEVDGRAVEHSRASDAAGADGDGELAGVELDGFVLRELEAEGAAEQVVVVALKDVEGAGVGAGDVASFFEDEVEEAVDLALGGEGLGDLDQLAELVAVAVEVLAAALGAGAGLEEVEAGLEGDREFVGGGVVGEDGDEAAAGGLGVGLARAPEEERGQLAVGDAGGVGLENVALEAPGGGGDQQQCAALQVAHQQQERVGPQAGNVMEMRVRREDLSHERERVLGAGRLLRHGAPGEAFTPLVPPMTRWSLCMREERTIPVFAWGCEEGVDPRGVMVTAWSNMPSRPGTRLMVALLSVAARVGASEPGVAPPVTAPAPGEAAPTGGTAWGPRQAFPEDVNFVPRAQAPDAFPLASFHQERFYLRDAEDRVRLFPGGLVQLESGFPGGSGPRTTGGCYSASRR
jgi:hypothetical protein